MAANKTETKRRIRRKNNHEMSKNHLTEGTVRAVTALHTRAFSALVRCPMTYAQTARLCLSNWITPLLIAVPLRSRATFIGLLCGCLISPEGG